MAPRQSVLDTVIGGKRSEGAFQYHQRQVGIVEHIFPYKDEAVGQVYRFNGQSPRRSFLCALFLPENAAFVGCRSMQTRKLSSPQRRRKRQAGEVASLEKYAVADPGHRVSVHRTRDRRVAFQIAFKAS